MSRNPLSVMRPSIDARSPSRSQRSWRCPKWFRSQVLSRGERGGAAGGIESFEEAVEVVAGELPFEWLGDLLVVSSEAEEPLFDCGEVGEVVGLQHLALDDREVDLELVEPAGVDWQVDEDEILVVALEAVNRALAAVGGAVVDDPEDAPGGGVGLPGHHLRDQAVERFDAALRLAAVEQLRPPDVPGGQVAERAHPLVLVLEQLSGTAGKRRRRRMQARPRLDRRLLVGAEHQLARVQQLALEAAGVEVEDPCGLDAEV